MMSGLGAAGSLIDALSSLTSSKSSSATTSTGQSRGANPFDPGSTQTKGTTGFSAGSTGGPSFSPQTMSALIQAQGQPGASDPTSTDGSTTDPGTNSSGIPTSALINVMDKIKLQPIDISQLKITALPAGSVNWVGFDSRV
jgi:hypothetical protein